jgi:hypothetical protein
MAAILGGDTLTELRQSLTIAESEVLGGASPRVAPFVDVRAFGSLAQRAGLALPVVDLDRATVRYADLFALVNDLRAFGAANSLNARSRTPLKREVLARAAAVYAERFSDPDGRLRATFDILWLSGWAPHESQQKPLKPGSATTRLADALKARRWFPDGFTTKGTKTHEGGVALRSPSWPCGEKSVPGGRDRGGAVKGRLGLTHELGARPELLDGLGVRILAIDERHALTFVEPDPMTRDPFDRMLLAQCQVEGLRLLTIDRALVSDPLAAKG